MREIISLLPALSQVVAMIGEQDLEDYTVADLPQKKTLVTLSQRDSLEGALATLFDNRVLSAPVLDEENKVTGIVSMVDIAVFAVLLARTSQDLVQWLGIPVENADFQVDLGDVRSLLQEGDEKEFEEALLSNPTQFLQNISQRNPVRVIHEKDSLTKLAGNLMEVSRVAITDDNGKLVNFVTQSDLIEFAWTKQCIDSVAKKNVKELGIGSSPVVSVKESQLAIEAFKLIALKGFDGVAVVNDEGKLVGNVSATDIRVMTATADSVDALYLKCDKYRQKMAGYNIPPKPVVVSEDDTIETIVALMEENKVHRVYVTKDEKPERVVTMTDVLCALYASATAS